jgi:hypothetical protein
MFVSLADAQHQAGTVERRSTGFLVGYLERYAPADQADDLLLEQWIQIFAKRFDLARDRSGLRVEGKLSPYLAFASPSRSGDLGPRAGTAPF